MPTQSDKTEFTGAHGTTLAAKLDMPAGKPKAYALFAHCFTCSKDFTTTARIAKALAQKGIAVLRFDFTGLGASEGDFANTNFSSNVEDLVAAAEFMREKYEAPSILIGHSFGGAAVLVAAGKIDGVEAVATINAPADPDHVQHHFCDVRPEIEEKGEAEVELAGRKFTIQKHFLEDIENQKMSDAIKNMDAALMVFHSPVDTTVGIENARQIYEAAKHPKSFISLDKANHFLSNSPEEADYVATVLAAWASRYVKK